MRAFLFASLSSTMAGMILLTALGKQIYDLTHEDIYLGLLGLAEFAPAFLLMTVTGSAADRFDRRRIVRLGLAGQILASGGLAWYASTNDTATWPIFALVLVFGTCRAFVGPAIRSLPPDLAPDGALPRLIAFNVACWQTAMIAGPVIAGFLYVGSVSWPFLACMVLTGIGVLMIGSATPRADRAHPAASLTGGDEAALIDVGESDRPAELLDALGERTAAHLIEESSTTGSIEAAEAEAEEKVGQFHQAFEGFRVIRRNPALLGAISLDLFAVLFGGAVALLPAIAEKRLGVDAVGLGWLRAAGGIGAATVTLLLSARPISRRVGPIMFLAVAMFGVFTIVLGLTRSFAVAFVAMVLLSAADSVSVFIRGTLVPLVTPSSARGRVMAVEGVFIGASNELGAFESGVAGQFLGTGPAVVLGGIATIGVVGIWTVLFPVLTKFDRFPERPPD